MTQHIDMRRLHMGCGESLQSHLPLPAYGKRRQQASPPVIIEHPDGEAKGSKKRSPEENH